MTDTGRPRQPISLLLLKGRKNLTKQEIRERQEQEVKGNTDNVVVPDYLPVKLQEEFTIIATELLRIDLITNTDVDTLARFIFSREQYVRLSLELRKTDPYDDDYATLLNNQDKLFRQCNVAAGALGLTVSSRCKLLVPKKKETKPTPFQKKFGDV